ncbi:MAG: DNA-formamidopyrimidine glycosylase family protein [Myxococcota bacterium]
MPELAEVEVGRRVAETVLAGRLLREVQCDPDERVFDQQPCREVRARLLGRTVRKVERKGKYLWFELDARPWPTFHFGMSGAFLARGGTLAAIQLRSGPRLDEQWPPRFTKIRMETEDGGELVMTNARRLGRIRLAFDPEREPPICKLGFDPWKEPMDPVEFRRRLTQRRGTLKGIFLDQSFAAGIGNWLADEILYQSGIDPRRTPSDLTAAECVKLHRELHRVVRTAVERQGQNLPRTWLFHHRWSKGRGREHPRTARGESIEFLTVAGRSTAFVPARQR